MEDDIKSPFMYHLISIFTKEHNQTNVNVNQTLGNMGRKLLLVSTSLAISLPGQRLIMHHTSNHPPFIFLDHPPSIISLMLLMIIFHVSEPFNSHSHSLLTAYYLSYPTAPILFDPLLMLFYKMKYLKSTNSSKP